VESFLQDAERILDTAAGSADRNSPEYVIGVLRSGTVRILSDVTGWSLPALAAELGAAALYRVSRTGALVQVEGWSFGRKCTLSRDTSHDWWSRPRVRTAQATFELLEGGGASQNDRSPQVRNS
jgi:hypothetical protein